MQVRQPRNLPPNRAPSALPRCRYGTPSTAPAHLRLCLGVTAAGGCLGACRRRRLAQGAPGLG